MSGCTVMAATLCDRVSLSASLICTLIDDGYETYRVTQGDFIAAGEVYRVVKND